MTDSNTTPTEQSDFATKEAKRFHRAHKLTKAQEYVHENAEGGEKAKIAVIDLALPPEAGKSTTDELDIVARETIGDASYYHSHGILSAATAAANWKNNVGIRGVSDAEIVAIGVEKTTKSAAKGVQAAIEHDPDVITMSLAGEDTDEFREAVKNARERGIVMVAAAGNDDKSLSENPVAPATYDGVITVGGTDSHGKRYGGSNYPTDVCAWAKNVPALENDTDSLNDTPYWWELSVYRGTSAATAVVAGVVVLMYEVNPNLIIKQVREILVETGTQLDTDHPIGPRVNAYKAVKAADAT